MMTHINHIKLWSNANGVERACRGFWCFVILEYVDNHANNEKLKLLMKILKVSLVHTYWLALKISEQSEFTGDLPNNTPPPSDVIFSQSYSPVLIVVLCRKWSHPHLTSMGTNYTKSIENPSCFWKRIIVRRYQLQAGSNVALVSGLQAECKTAFAWVTKSRR